MRLLSRNGLDWTARFPGVAEALAALPASGTWLDGEAVVFDERGVSDFGALQRALKEGRRTTVTYVAFDLLFEDGEDLRELPLRERKRRLERLLKRGGRKLHGVVRFGDHIEGRGGAVFEEACLQRLEGVVSKRADGTYAGRRTRSWLKTKCGRRQEFVVGGFTEPSGARRGFGALLLGVYDQEGALRYAGRVGSGFDDATLARLHARLKKLETGAPAFADPPRGAQARGVHWTEPRLVAEVAFTEWTGDGQLRHPVFKGLREDKAPEDVARGARGRRTAAAADAAVAEPPEPAPIRAPDAGRPSRRPPRAEAAGPAPPASRWSAASTISHPDRVVFPDPGLTKLDVVRYYEAVAGPHGAVSGPARPDRHPLPRRDRRRSASSRSTSRRRSRARWPRCACAAPTRRRTSSTRSWTAPKACWPWSRTAPWSSTSGARG